jgi:hypothetical protein
MKLPTRMWPHGQKWAEYNEIIPAGTPLSAILCRDFWIHVQSYLRPFDVINCVAEDGSFDVSIRLLSRTPTEMKFRVIREAKIDDASPIARDNPGERYLVQSGGRAGGWRIREKSTGNLIADGLDKASADAEKAKLEMAA